MIKGTILSRRVDTATDVPFYIREDFDLMLNTSEARRRAVTLPSSFDVVLNVVGTRTSQGASSQPTANDNGYFHAVVELLDGSKYAHTCTHVHAYVHTHRHVNTCVHTHTHTDM